MTPNLPVYEKYGEASIAGFQALPDILLRHQHKLKLSSAQLNVLLNILMHWWYVDRKPCPATSTIAKRIGVTERTVQRALKGLVENGLIEKETGDIERTHYNPAPLVRKLNELTNIDGDYQIRRSMKNEVSGLEASPAR